MTQQPDISVVIPAYNAERCISRAIESVLAQTRPVREVIVVDDGSQDETAAVVGRFDAPVRLVQQANGGPAAARNYGVRAAQGEWTAFLDADDAWLPEKIERQAKLLGRERVGVAHCYVAGEHDKFRYEGELTFERMWRQNMIGTSTAVVRKAAWESVGGFQEDRRIMGVEDYHFWLRIVAAGWRVALCPEELSQYTPAEFNLSSQVEQILAAELLNAELIAGALGLPPATLRAKQAAIYAEYGDEYIHQRDFTAARACLAQSLRRGPSMRIALRLLGSLAPVSLIARLRPAAGRPHNVPLAQAN